MTTTATDFQPMLSTVLPSQDIEVTLGKQPILAEYGREVRTAISALPPEVSNGLLAEYREPTPQLVASLENAIMSRELAIENAAQGQNLDQEWLASAGGGRRMDESAVGAGDDWGTPGI
jgi:hypothetical protein